MKRTLTFSTFAAIALAILWACGGAAGPKEVGEKFLLAFSSGDLATSKQLATKEAQKSLDMVKGSMPAKEAAPSKIVIGEVEEQGDKATLNYVENGLPKKLSLVKEDGQWKAAWNKLDGSQAPPQAPETPPGSDLPAADSASHDSVAPTRD